MEQEEEASFAKLALERTDLRVQSGKSISPGFLFATLMWHQVEEKWRAFVQLKKPLIPALHEAIDEVLQSQREVFAIQRRFETDMREIWSLQPRFERRVGKMPYRLMESPRFRAGYDFLCLRCEAGELPLSLSSWWETFQQASLDTQESMLTEVRNEPKSQSPSNLSTTPGKSRRRRRRSPKNQAQRLNSDDNGQPSENLFKVE